MSKYDCKVCGEQFSPKLEDELVEHLRDHYENASHEVYLAESQLEDLDKELEGQL